MLEVWDEISVDTHMQMEILPINAMQYDNLTRKIRCTLTDNGNNLVLDDDVRAYFYSKKTDGNTSFLTAEVTDRRNGVVEVTLTNQSLAKAGKVYCMIALMKGQKLLSSFYFYIDVAPNIFDINAIESTSEFKALLDALERVEGLLGAEGILQDQITALEKRVNAHDKRLNTAEAEIKDLKENQGGTGGGSVSVGELEW